MFKNVGKVIKGIAKFVFVIDLLSVLILAIVVLAGAIDGGEGGIGFLIFLGILVVGFIISYLSVMMLYAFGSIVDDVKAVKESLRGTAPAPAYPASAPAYTAAPATPATPVAPETPAPPATPVMAQEENTDWVCPKCSHTNKAENRFCTNCGSGKDA